VSNFRALALIPNLFTCCNLLLGVIAIVLSIEGYIVWSVYAVVGAAIFDVLDGAVARILSVKSLIGKDLDSLADVVSFGVVPAVWATLIAVELNKVAALQIGIHWIGLAIAPASAWRLAKFNHDQRQTNGFIGLATPANTLFWAGVLLFVQSNQLVLTHLSSEAYTLITVGFVVLSIIMLHAEVPMLSLKWKAGSVKGNPYFFVLLAMGLVMVLIFNTHALAPIVVGYVLLSLLANKFTTVKRI
jgi:CDP-diacylglycerol--serine O-phosphatidyltransferase